MNRPLLKPKKLQPGDTIALMAPSSWCEPEAGTLAAAQLEKHGYKVFIHPQCHARDNMSAGTAEEKVAALHAVFSDPAIDAVFCLRGGYRAIHILDTIDYDLIRQNPKIFMGYSDITTLHAALLARSKLVTFHGPTANSLRDMNDAALVDAHKTWGAALDFLSGAIPQDMLHDAPVTTLQQGEATATLWGGNMQLLSALIQSGNRYHPAFDKTILVIEDIGEEIAKIDTQLGAWRLRGIFKNLAGLIVGGLTDIKDTPGRAGSFVYTMEDIIRQHTADIQGPVIMGAPFGHQHPNYIFPQGVQATLKAQNNNRATLSLLESPFAA